MIYCDYIDGGMRKYERITKRVQPDNKHFKEK